MKTSPSIRSVLAAIFSILFLFGLVFFLGRPASAGNPITVGSNGQPAKWATFPIHYTPDGGTLGGLSNTQANSLVTAAFGAWTGVASATVTVSQNAPGLPGEAAGQDISTVPEYNALACVGLNPIVYDTTGTLTDDLLGAGASNSVLGFAGPCAIDSTNTILGGHGVINGKPLAGTPTALDMSRTQDVMTHELGHFLGLGHSQVNLNCLTNPSSCPSNTPGGDLFGVPTMFPILLNQTEVPNQAFGVTLAADDISSISTLYPAASFTTSFGTISGKVLFSDGVTPVQGANVIARRNGDPTVTAVSNVSGMLASANHGNPVLGLPASQTGSPDPTIRGNFTIPGLPPGTYTLDVESVYPSFTGGSDLGPLSAQTGRDENIPVPGSAECLGVSPCTNIPVTMGSATIGQNFILNEILPTLDSFDTTARNESIAAPSYISNGTFNASISSQNGSDTDVYAISVKAGQTLTVETMSQRLTPSRFLDTVLDITDATGVQPQTCNIGDASGSFTSACVDDDFTTAGGLFTHDSKLQFSPAVSGLVFVRVTDHFGDARPDFLYNLIVTGAQPVPTVTFTPPVLTFGPQNVGASTTQNVQVQNESGSAVTLNSLTVPTGGADFFTVAPTSGSPACNLLSTTPLAAGGVCFFGVKFTPSTGGLRNGVVHGNDTAADTPAVLSASGTGSSGPPNDNFVNAITTNTNPFSDTEDTTLATQETGTDIPLTTAPCSLSSPPANDKSIWYKYHVPVAGIAQMEVFAPYNSALAVGIGPLPLSSTFCLPIPANTSSTLNVDVSMAVGTDLYFMVAAQAGDGGITTFTLTFAPTGVNADLSIAATTGGAVFTEGSQGTYTITVSNANGTGATPTTAAIPIVVRDVLPLGLTFANSTGSDPSWSCSPVSQVVTCNDSSTLANGASTKIVLTANVAPPAAANSPVQDIATVFGGGDITPANNTTIPPVSTVVNPAPAPGVGLAPVPSDFGSVVVGNTSATQTVTLTNSGTAPLNVTSIALGGTDFSQFNLITAPSGGFTCSSGTNSIPPSEGGANSSCTFGVNFFPLSVGAKSARVIVNNNAKSSPDTVPLSGTATSNGGTATLSFAANSINFSPPSITVGDVSAAGSDTLTNNGPVSVTITSINATGANTNDFNGAPFLAGDCTDGGNGGTATTLTATAPGNTCNLRGVFNPTAAGARQSIISIIATAAANIPQVTLNGTALAANGLASVSALPNPENFPDQVVATTSAILTSVVTNNGAGDATITKIRINGANSSNYVQVTPLLATDCQQGMTLTTTGPGNSCNFRAQFTPTAGGLLSATANISLTNVSTSPYAITLNGNGAAPTAIVTSTGTPQNVTISTAFAALVAKVTDASLNPIAGVTVTFTAPSSGASGTFPGPSNSAQVTTDINGLATAPTFTANTTAGSYNVTASAAGVVGSVNFALTNNAGAAMSIAPTTGSGQQAAINTAFGINLKATVTDGSGNGVSNVSVTFTAPSSGASGTFPGPLTSATVNTDVNGVATAPVFTANSTIGGPYLVAAKAGLIGPANFSLTNIATPPNNFTNNNGTGDGLWQTGTNWSAGHAPLSTEIATDTGGLNITLSSGAQSASAMTFNNGGTLTISGGSLTFTSASTASGLAVSGGTLTANATLSVSGTFSLTGTGVLTGAGTVTLNGPATLNGGTMSGAGATNIAAGNTLTIGGSADSALSQRTVNNSGTVNWTTNNINADNGAVINNLAGATFHASNSAAVIFQFPSGGIGSNPTFNNAGTFLEDGTQFTDFLHATFTNTGTVNIFGKSLQFVSCTLTQTAGSINFANGGLPNNAILTLGASDILQLSGGSLTGNGIVSGGSVNNSGGQVSPGTSTTAGTITIRNTGTYTQGAGGTLNIKLGGTAAGQFDVLDASAGSLATSIGGTLHVTAIGGFVPPADSTYVVMLYAAHGVSDFATKNLNGLPLTEATNSNNVTLTGPAGAATAIVATTGSTQNTTISTQFTNPLQATVTDAGGLPVPNVVVTFGAPAQSGASVTFPGGVNTATTNANGAASIAITANSHAGTYSVTASVPGVATQATFTSLTNNPGPAQNIGVTAGSGQQAPINTQFTTNLQATVTDASNNGVSNVSVTFTAPSSGASGTFPGSLMSATVNTDVNGIATAPALTANGTVGGPYLVAAKAGLIGPANFSLTNIATPPNNFTNNNGTGDGLWQTGTNWSAGHAPLSTEIATDTGGLNITLSSGAQSASAMTFNNGGTLTISGGSLTFSSASTATNITINGGTLTANANLTLSTLALSSGTLNGTGTVSLGGGSTLTFSGGTMGGTGTTVSSGTVSITGGTLSSTMEIASGGTATTSGATALTFAAGTLKIDSGATFHTFPGTGGFSGAGTVNNAGTFDRTGAVFMVNSGIVFNNSGTVSVSGSFLYLLGGGTSSGSFTVLSVGNLHVGSGGTPTTWSAGSSVTGAGSVLFDSGTTNINGSYNVTGLTAIQGTPATIVNFNSAASTGALAFTNGVLGGTGNVSVNGTMTWSGGTIGNSGTTTIAGTGTLNLTNVNSPKQSAGTLSIAGTANVTGALDIGGGATISVQPTGTFNVAADVFIGSNTVLGASTFNNAGIVAKTAGTAAGGGGFTNSVTFNNMGTVNASSGTLHFDGGLLQTGASSITNLDHGTQGGGNISGNLTINGGVLEGTGTVTGNVNVGASGHVSPALVVGLANSFSVLSISGNYTNAGSLGIGLAGAGCTNFNSLAVSGTATLNGGSLVAINAGGCTPGPSQQFQVITFGSLAGSDFAMTSLTVNGVTLIQALNATNLTLIAPGPVTFTNGGGDSQWTNPLNWNPALVPIAGDTVNIPGGFSPILSSGAQSIGALNMTSTGTLTISGGGSLTLTSASTATNITLNGGTLTANANLTVGTLNVIAGLLNGTGNVTTDPMVWSGGTISTSGNFIINGPGTWSGGTFNGTGMMTVSNTGTLTISGATLKQFATGTFNNAGTVTWSGGSSGLDVGSGAVFNNQVGATFNIQSGATFGNGLETGPSTFNNMGTLANAVGAGTTVFGNNAAFNNTATVNVISGTLSLQSGGADSGTFTVGPAGTLNFGGGASTLTASSIVTGPGTVSFSGGTTTAAGTYNLTNTNISGGTVSFNATANSTNLTLSGGFSSGSAPLMVPGAFNWTAGTINGAGTTMVTNTGTLTISGAGSKQLAVGTFINAGTATWMSGSSGLDVGGNAVFINQMGATFTIQSDATFGNALESGPSTFVNAGTLTKTAGAGTTTFGPNANAAFNSTGPVTVNSGTLSLQGGGSSVGGFVAGAAGTLNFGGGTNTLGVGSSVTGAGTVSFTGGTTSVVGSYNVTGSTNISGGMVNFDSSATSTNVTFTGGFSSGPGTLTVPGLFSWSAGTINGGTTTVTNTGTLTISGAGLKQFASATFNNAGAATWMSGSSGLDVGLGAVFNNQPGATFTIQSDTNFANGLETGAATFNNMGTLIKSAGAGTTQFGNTVAFNNTGTLNANSGTIAFGGGFTQSAGATTLNGGNLGGGTTFTFSGGTLFGINTITGNVNNTGATVKPGLSPGTLSIMGNYTQGANGILNVELGGTGAGQFDVLAISGTATLGGTLNAVSFGGFTPGAGNSFAVMTFTSKSGDFAETSLTVNGVLLDKIFHANNMVLATPGSAQFINTTSGTPQMATINTAFTSPLQVTVTDGGGLPVSGVTVTFTAPAQTGASGTFAPGGATAMTDVNGVATSGTFMANSHAGTYMATASFAGAATPASFGLTNTAGAAANIAATGGTPQIATVNMAFATALSATVTDSGGNPVSGVTVTFTAPVQTGASGTFAGGTNTAMTNSSGIATAVAFTANTHAGAYMVTAGFTGVATPASFSLTNTAGAAANITASVGTPQATTISTAFATPLSATVTDGSGNPVPNVTVTFTAPAQTGASATFTGGTTTALTGANGVATSVAIMANSHAGAYIVTASVSGVATPANFNLNNTSGTPANIAATGGTPQNAAINTAFASALSATVTDMGGNPVAGAMVTFTAPAQTGASGTFASGTTTAVTGANGVATSVIFTANGHAGAYMVTAGVSGVATLANFNLTNTAGAAANIAVTGGTPQMATINTAFATALSATVTDSGGNPVSGATVTFTAPAQTGASVTFMGGTTTALTNASGVATSVAITANSHAGAYVVTAGVTGVAAMANFNLTNTAGSPANIAATGGTPQNATVNTAFTTALSATVTDSGGNLVPGAMVTFTAPAQTGASVTFTGGTTTAVTGANGVATSVVIVANSHAGAYVVTAGVGGVATMANFNLTNTAGAPASITATAGTGQSANASAAFAATLQATVKDAFGNLVSGAIVTFAPPANGAGGSFAGGVNTATTNASGVATSAVFTANATAGGPYNVTASVTGVVATASFSLTNVDFSVASPTGPQTVKAGVTANYTVDFMALIGPTVSSTTFSCQNLPALANCVFVPPSLAANTPLGTTPVMLGISTTARAGSSAPGRLESPSLPDGSQPFRLLMLVAALLIAVTPWRSRIQNLTRMRLAHLAMLAGVLLGASFIVGCAGAGFPAGQQGTPAGMYNVTVVATSGTVQRTTTVTLNVQ